MSRDARGRPVYGDPPVPAPCVGPLCRRERRCASRSRPFYVPFIEGGHLTPSGTGNEAVEPGRRLPPHRPGAVCRVYQTMERASKTGPSTQVRL
jgi:hypothetical protein